MGVVVHIGHQKPVPEGTGWPDSKPVKAYLGRRLAPGFTSGHPGGTGNNCKAS